MSKHCVCCGVPLPESHRYRTCSVCYGDPDWGTDGYLREMMETDQRLAAEEEWAAQEREETDATDGS